MASNLSIVEYVCDQIRPAGNISYKKMFGEYTVYCDAKVIGVICEDQFFVKMTASGRRLCPDCEEAAPYEGAKPHLLMERMDDRELMTELIRATCDELPQPRPKKTKRRMPE